MKLRYGVLLITSADEIKQLYSYVTGQACCENVSVQIDFRDKEIGLFDDEGYAVSQRYFDEIF